MSPPLCSQQQRGSGLGRAGHCSLKLLSQLRAGSRKLWLCTTLRGFLKATTRRERSDTVPRITDSKCASGIGTVWLITYRFSVVKTNKKKNKWVGTNKTLIKEEDDQTTKREIQDPPVVRTKMISKPGSHVCNYCTNLPSPHELLNSSDYENGIYELVSQYVVMANVWLFVIKVSPGPGPGDPHVLHVLDVLQLWHTWIK